MSNITKLADQIAELMEVEATRGDGLDLVYQNIDDIMDSDGADELLSEFADALMAKGDSLPLPVHLSFLIATAQGDVRPSCYAGFRQFTWDLCVRLGGEKKAKAAMAGL